MKNAFAAICIFLLLLVSISFAQSSTSSQAIEALLSEQDIRSELQKIDPQITTLLGDQRLTDEATRQMLIQSKAVIAEMLSQKIGTNTHKLVALAKWQRDQALARHSIHDAGGEPDAGQQLTLENPMGGQEVYLTSVIKWILNEYLWIDGETAGNANLEAWLEMYFSFRDTLERGADMADSILFKAPAWTQARYPQLDNAKKLQFLKDVQESRADKAQGLGPDEEPGPTPTAQEQAAYDAAYQFIVSNTPQP